MGEQRSNGHTSYLEQQEIDVNSPFLSLDDEPTLLERVKLVLCAPLACARLVCMATLFLVLAVVCLLLVPSRASPDTPLPWLRKYAIAVCTHLCAALALLVCGIIPWIRGMQHVNSAKRARAICVFNHLSYIDSLVLVSAFGGTFVAKGGVDSIPLVGTVAKGLQCVFVERSGSSDKSSCARSGGTSTLLAQRARDSRFPLCFVAPEATTHTGKYLLRFQTGAFVSGLPVLPVLIRYPRKRRQFNPAWGVTDTVMHLYRAACQLITPVDVRVLPVYYPSQSEKENPREYAANVRELMSKEMQLPLCDQGVEDCQALLDRGVYAINGQVIQKDPKAVKAAVGIQGDASEAGWRHRRSSVSDAHARENNDSNDEGSSSNNNNKNNHNNSRQAKTMPAEHGPNSTITSTHARSNGYAAHFAKHGAGESWKAELNGESVPLVLSDGANGGNIARQSGNVLDRTHTLDP